MNQQFSRTELLLGSNSTKILSQCRVAVFGVGGVGGYVVEALARAGVGSLELTDSDTLSMSNINRQIIALHSTIGQKKVDVAAARIKDINPDCRVIVHDCFYLPKNSNEFDFSKFDYVVDAVDTVSAKIDIICRAKEANVPVISAMGAGNKLDPTQFCVADIYSTKVCPLARIMRTNLRKRGIDSLKVVYSQEPPKVTGKTDEKTKRSIPGSVPFVPSVAGLIIAGEVIKDLIKGEFSCREN